MLEKIVFLSAMVAQASAQTDKDKTLGETCSEFGDDTCVGDLKCLDDNPDRTTEQASIYRCTAPSELNKWCSKSYGDFACVDSLKCTESVKCHGDIFCIEENSPTCQDPLKKELGQVCKSDSDECAEGLVCRDPAPDRLTKDIIAYRCQASDPEPECTSHEECSKIESICLTVEGAYCPGSICLNDDLPIVNGASGSCQKPKFVGCMADATPTTCGQHFECVKEFMLNNEPYDGYCKFSDVVPEPTVIPAKCVTANNVRR